MRYDRRLIWIVSLLFVALAALYSFVNPVFEAPDELWHYRYIVHLARGGGLPVQTSEAEANVAQQEGSQPPLYYALGALMVLVPRNILGVADNDPQFRLNQMAVGQPESEEKAMVLHTGEESFPYRGTLLLAHLLRILSVLLGLGTVLVTYQIALEVMPGRRGIAAAAAAFNAFIPMFGFISASINNDNLATLLSSLALWQTLRTLRLGPSLRRTLILGGLVGLAALTKVSGLALLPLALLGLAVATAHRRRGVRPLLRHGGLVLAMVALIAGWWYLRNMRLYGDPLGLDLMLQVAGRRSAPSTPLLPGLGELHVLLMSLWGVFGWSNVFAQPWFYAAFEALSALALAGLAYCLYLYRSTINKQAAGAAGPALLAAWVAVFLVALFHWMQTADSAAQGRLLFPAVSAISVLAALGLSALPRRPALAAGGSVAVAMAVLSFVAPFAFILPAYPALPQLLTTESLDAGVQRANVDFGDQMQLVGFELKSRKVKPGQPIELTFYWRVGKPSSQFLSLYLYFQDRNGNRAAFRGRGTYYLGDWKEGQLLRSEHAVTLPQNIEPLLLQVHLGLFDPMTGERLEARDGQGRALGGSALLTYIRVMPTAPPETVEAGPTTTTFGGQIALINWDISWEGAKPGGTLSGDLYWQPLRPPEGDYTVFVQLIGPQGLIAQYDAEPQGGEYPTSLWDAKEIVPDHFSLSLPPD
ncbi:MAG: DUF2142 domain-containing protein, partial [Bacteroidetes bacterium]|nr:DUF2142 domain-containing protein [Bacteroidota bacterium]